MSKTLAELESTAKQTIEWIAKLDVPASVRVQAIGKIEVIAKRLGREAYDQMREERRKG